MARCDFCGTVIEAGTGKIYVKKDGTVIHFCSNKCEKCMIKLKRKPLFTKWTAAYRAKKGSKK